MNYVIIGNGIAGTTAAAQIREIDTNGNITVISDEEIPHYSRIRLIDFLAGNIDKEGLIIKNEQWHRERNIELILGDPAVDVDTTKKILKTRSNSKLSFDKLLLATGSNAFIPPIPGSDLVGVFSLRRIFDAEEILGYLGSDPKRVIIIGGGVLGLEVGNALRRRGHTITVVEAFPRLLPRQMDPIGAEILKEQLESFGFNFKIGRKTLEIFGGSSVEGIKLDDQTEITADMVIISAGIRPNLDLANKLELNIDKGIIVDDNLKTSENDIYAAGDGIIHNGRLYGIWSASEDQGRSAGVNMAGKGKDQRYTGTTISNVLKVVGIELISIGDIDAESKNESIIYKDPEKFIYKKLVLSQDKIIGAIFYGDKANWLKVRTAINKGIDIKEIKPELKNWNFANL